MRKKNVDWELFQKLHDEGRTVKSLIKEFNISVTIVFKARKAGLVVIKRHKYAHTEEAKARISQGRKKFCIENPKAHAWSLRHKTSVPCNIVKQYLRDNNISFLEEYRPLDDRMFQVDIAFPDKKIGIEINGNQHYDSDKKLKPYYQERHDLIESAGWQLLELHFSIAFNTEQLDKLVHELKNNLKIENADYTFFIKSKSKAKYKTKYGGREGYTKAVREQNANIAISRIEKIKNSDIDFSKIGWVMQVSSLIGIKPQKVNGFMKKYMPDFLNSCYSKNMSKNVL